MALKINIALELYSIFISLVLLYGSWFEIGKHTKRNVIFTIAVMLNALSLITDFLSYRYNGRSDLTAVLYIVNFLAYTFGYMLIGIYSVYIICYLKEKQELEKNYLKPVLICFGITEALLIIFTLTGGYFHIENGNYLIGKLYPISQLYPFLCIIYNLYLVRRFSNIIGRHDTFAMLSYIVTPIISVIMHFWMPQVSFAYVASTVALLITYIMLQAELERVYKQRERVLIDESNTDMLTGLLNRRAYNAICDMRLENNAVGVIFCDINGLKYTNDNLGHAAGDSLIQEMRDYLLQSFRRDEVFRISGDEFVVIMPHLVQSKFEARAFEFKQRLQRKEIPIASMGTAYGTGSDLLELIKAAETAMYEDKHDFYIRFPQFAGRKHV